MDIYEIIIRISVQMLSLASSMLQNWVTLPANVTGPLDPSATLTDGGTTFIHNMATIALTVTHLLCDIADGLFAVS